MDARATRVEVEIEGGAVSLLRVRDDGSGMYPEDAERAVGRHATSKISTAEDLARVGAAEMSVRKQSRLPQNRQLRPAIRCA